MIYVLAIIIASTLWVFSCARLSGLADLRSQNEQRKAERSAKGRGGGGHHNRSDIHA